VLSFIAIFLSNVVNWLSGPLMSTNSPYLALRPPLTQATLYPFLLNYYVHAVLAILPNTFLFKLVLLPFILWQAWNCTVRYDYAVFFAQSLGHRDGLGYLNMIFAVRALFLNDVQR
jgi:hypothetical protein